MLFAVTALGIVAPPALKVAPSEKHGGAYSRSVNEGASLNIKQSVIFHITVLLVKIPCNYFLLPLGRKTCEFSGKAAHSDYKVGVFFGVLLRIKQRFL